MTRIEIPVKLPSLNDYIAACRGNAYGGASMKKRIQKEISPYISKLPKFNNPIYIHFHWVEGNSRRDLDNVAASRKFILDAMVECGKLKDDNRKCVLGFTDTFSVEKGLYKVILEISEVTD